MHMGGWMMKDQTFERGIIDVHQELNAAWAKECDRLRAENAEPRKQIAEFPATCSELQELNGGAAVRSDGS